MSREVTPIAFGPVPSRRLGHSLGINNIPPKICTYSCVYCQLGRTLRKSVKRETFYEPEMITEDVGKKVQGAREKGEAIDYLTFVPDGEPTLDVNLGKEIELISGLEIKIAVISNASLIWLEDVRNDLQRADWVSLKIDAMSENMWRDINRPQRSLRLEEILGGALEFSKSYKGELTTETMLIQDFNDSEDELHKIANFITSLDPKKSYLSIPTRPPAERWVEPAAEHMINKAYQLFSEKSIDVEYLIGYEGNAFAFTGNVEEDLLSITSVHPMREEAVKEFLTRASSDWSVIHRLIDEGKLIELEYEGKKFYMRKLHSAAEPQ
jgi:wyosine [tRNA(Phe)-imidazoG37] synthetase (radical SAM superfamily)